MYSHLVFTLGKYPQSQSGSEKSSPSTTSDEMSTEEKEVDAVSLLNNINSKYTILILWAEMLKVRLLMND